MAGEWSGLACRRCGHEVSTKIARRTRGYCDECGQRLYSLQNGQRNPWPIKRKQEREGSTSHAG